jgi:tetratricopeptide (TPR) repeat protein
LSELYTKPGGIKRYTFGLQIQYDVEEAKELYNKWGGNALGIRQAVSYINTSSKVKDGEYTITDFLNEFTVHEADLLENPFDLSSNYDKTVVIIVTQTDEKLASNFGRTGGLAVELLQLLSLINGDGIRKDFILQLYKWGNNNTEPNEEVVAEAFSWLITFSVIEIKHDLITIHRLIQAVVRQHGKWIERVKQVFQKCDIRCLKINEFMHMLKMWDYASTIKEVILENKETAENLFWRMFELSIIHNMEHFARKNSDILKSTLGGNHVSTLKMESNIGLALHENGRYHESLAIYEQILDKMVKKLGENHRSTILTGIRMGNVLCFLDRLPESQSRFENIAKKCEKELQEDEWLLHFYNRHFALLLLAQKKYNEALTIFSQVFSYRSKAYGANNLDTSSSRDDFARCLVFLKRFPEAVKEYEDLLHVSKLHYTQGHILTLSCTHNYAWALGESGDFDKAIQILQNLLPLRERFLGKTHPDTIATRNNLKIYKAESRKLTNSYT